MKNTFIFRNITISAKQNESNKKKIPKQTNFKLKNKKKIILEIFKINIKYDTEYFRNKIESINELNTLYIETNEIKLPENIEEELLKFYNLNIAYINETLNMIEKDLISCIEKEQNKLNKQFGKQINDNEVVKDIKKSEIGVNEKKIESTIIVSNKEFNNELIP